MVRNTKKKQSSDSFEIPLHRSKSPICESAEKRERFFKDFRVVSLKYEQVLKFVNKVMVIGEVSIPELQIRIENLSKLQLEHDQLMAAIIELESDSDFQEVLYDVEKLNDDICELKAKLQAKVQIQSGPNPLVEKRAETFSGFGNIKPKLPNIPIPKFDGRPENWIPFRNTFVALIHNDKNLPGVVKYTYLLDCLNQDTKIQFGTIILSDDGYAFAWKTLIDNYDNKRKIVHHHIDALLNLVQISKDNHKDLQHLINVCTSNISALKECQQNLEGLGEQMLISIVLKKIDLSLRKDWENEMTTKDLPTWDNLIEFLKKKCRILESVDSTKRAVINSMEIGKRNQGFQRHQQYSKPKLGIPDTQTFLATNSNLGAIPKTFNNTKPSFHSFNKNQSEKARSNPEICVICQATHIIYNCPKFLLMSTHERYNKIKELKLCINCLKNHTLKDCPSNKCKICSDPHHTLLHHVQSIASFNTLNNETGHSSSSEVNSVPNLPERINMYAERCADAKRVVLPTAIILIKDKCGKFQECRALLDSCSDANYIAAHIVEKLKLPRTKNQVSISGLNHSKSSADEEICTTVRSKVSKFESILNFSVVPEISLPIPSSSLDISRWEIPSHLKLADPNFNVSRSIDILIGGEIFFETIANSKHFLKRGYPLLVETVFGWIIAGKIEQRNDIKHRTNFFLQTKKKLDLHESLKRFFDVESVVDKKHLSEEETICETRFMETHYRNNNGRYIVSIPLRESYTKLGESKTQAVNRFLSLERKLEANVHLKREYTEIMNEYLQLGHMKPIELKGLSSEKPDHVFYMPHHSVIKLSSSTTKVRVVFDASAKSSSNISLNEVMMVGPTVQQTCFDITLRFRKHRYVFTSDINKMYRQVLINPTQTPLQRILWRADKTEPIDIYEMQTVTFGTASAPYLATRTLKQLALDESLKYPKASNVTQRDFYVDDILTGTEDIDELVDIQQQLIQMLAKGGFVLHKWSSNHERILENIPIQNREILKKNETDSSECIKALGLAWQPKEDCFTFIIPTITVCPMLTKRKVVSEIAKLYDPLGLLGPIIISAKIFIQKLWKDNTDWDERVSDTIFQSWETFRVNLSALNHIEIKRRVLCDKPISIQLHGFADASESAYGACIYIRSVDELERVHVKLVCSKTRVAPIKTVSLPRLELCAALLLSRLVRTVITALDMRIDKVYLWSDSQISLIWIKTETHKLKVFIANRVSEIQDLTKSFLWNHIPTEENPADVISRGILPHELQNCHLWWNGPRRIYASEFLTNFDYVNRNFNVLDLELKKEYTALTAVTMSADKNPNELINRYSSYMRLLRISAYCLRFSHNAKSRNIRIQGPLTLQEIQNAQHALVQVVQETHFKSEITTLKKDRQLPRKSEIISLNPFLDSKGLLRVGGRLSKSDLDYDQKHPLLLPSKGNFTELVFRFYHEQNLHAGPQLLVSLIRQTFWPISAKNKAKKCIRCCIVCFKAKPKINSQLMGDLPTERVKPARAFNTTGIDFCGPFMMKNKRQRNASAHKVYICIFVCFVIKAVHFEVVSDLTSASFIACLKRFIFRRGKPNTIFSDNATNFHGAKNKLDEMYQLLKSELVVRDIEQFCIIEQIKWEFTPPRSPNFGGLWESTVKSLKTHLKRVASTMVFSYEELNTFIIQIEGILNSRPLTQLSSDPNDPSPLTPAHFLCGGSIVAPAEPDLSNIPINRLQNWEKITQAVQGFWKRYSIEYLHSLQQRTKWKSSNQNLNKDDIVLICNEQLPSTQWSLGRILEIYKGQDDRVRVCKLLSRGKILTRSISKICKLPCGDSL